MATSQVSTVIQKLRKIVLLREGKALTDAQLLEDFIRHLDEAALAALVHRHGPMVWGVCRRVLQNYHDAEDSFQATFLVLVRKAATIASPELLANWLYGVAYQTSLKARATAGKRRARERQVTQMPEPAVVEKDLWNDIRPLLDQELSRLPDIYRVAIVLCDLEEKTRKEAARQLGVPEGTLAARLTRGRAMLAKQLARHGLAVSGGSLAVVLAQGAETTSVPTSVMSSTIKAAALFAVGQEAATGSISASVATLTQGVLNTMYFTKLKIATAVLLSAIGLGGVLLNYPSMAADQPVKVTPVQIRSEAAKREQAQASDKDGEALEFLRDYKVLRVLKCTLAQREKIEDALEEMDDKVRTLDIKQIGVPQAIPGGPPPVPAGAPLPGVNVVFGHGLIPFQEEINKTGKFVLTKVLQKEQVERLSQIVLQTRGPWAFQLPHVVRALELTQDQLAYVETQIQKVENDIQAKSQKMVGPGVIFAGPPDQKEVALIFQGAVNSIQEKLTPKQKNEWKELVGEPLKFTPKTNFNGLTSGTVSVIGGAGLRPIPAVPAVPALPPGKPDRN